tara:strand:+ start:267 stop:734 length:468 start_codon:yes stop_codon:yes gene_type:complete
MNIPIINSSLEKTKESTIYNDPKYLRFNYWSAISTFSNIHPADIRKKQETIFIKKTREKTIPIEGMVRTLFSVNNNCNMPILNFSIFNKNTGNIIFKLPEFPDKKSISLIFQKAGVYQSNCLIPGSKIFTKFIFTIYTEIITPTPKNFDWSLRPY